MYADYILIVYCKYIYIYRYISLICGSLVVWEEDYLTFFLYKWAMLASGVQIAHPGKASITKPSLDPLVTLNSRSRLTSSC